MREKLSPNAPLPPVRSANKFLTLEWKAFRNFKGMGVVGFFAAPC
jgi:hypothetical protein